MKWTESDITFLREHYYENGSAFCAEKLGRTNSSIYSKAQKLGIKSKHKKLKTTTQYVSELLERELKVLGNYINDYTPISHECSVCGNIWDNSPSHILQGQGCPSCKGGVAKSHEKYVEQLNRQDIEVLDNYVNAITSLKHKCLVCNTSWNIQPSSALRNIQCPTCLPSGFNRDKSAILYYIKIGDYYKLGVTNRTIFKRFELDKDKPIKILLEKKFALGICAEKEEKKLIKQFKAYKAHAPEYLKSGGNTELFKFDILELDK